MNMPRFARSLGFFGLVVVVLVSAVLGSFAIWFQMPGPAVLRIGVAVLLDLLAVMALVGLGWRRRWRLGFAYALAFAALLIWWGTIKPSNDRDWAPDVAHGVTGIARGNELALKNVRNFKWRSRADFTENWEDRSYDLSKVKSVDFYLVYFMGPLVAHSMVSFGFEDGRYLMFSIEIRKERDEAFSAIAGFFKRYELVFLAADERDFLFLRKADHEDVRLYRIRTTPEAARGLLLEYIQQANDLADHPQFYNTLTTNCTTTIFVMLRALSPMFPLDWRVVLNGFLPSYAYENGLVDTSLPLAELIERSAVSDRIEMGLSEIEFGERMRAGLPAPH